MSVSIIPGMKLNPERKPELAAGDVVGWEGGPWGYRTRVAKLLLPLSPSSAFKLPVLIMAISVSSQASFASGSTS